MSDNAAPPAAAGPPPGTRSGRRLTPLRQFFYRIATPFAAGIVQLWWRLCRVEAVVGRERLEGAIARHGAVIPVYWHQHQLFAVKLLLESRAQGLKLGFLVSPSVDGELPSNIIRRFGGYVIRGSSNYTGARALRDYYQAIAKEGISPAITPDGPRGPPHEFKPGAVLLAQLSQKPIVPFAYAARPVFLFRSWDRFVLPWWFARVVIAVGEPQQVPRSLDPAALEQWQQRMAELLERTYAEARAALDR